MIRNKRYYNPYKIGRALYRFGFGISDIWSAVKSDEDMDEALRGYTDAKEAAEGARADLKEIRSSLGYSRIGRHNV